MRGKKPPSSHPPPPPCPVSLTVHFPRWWRLCQRAGCSFTLLSVMVNVPKGLSGGGAAQ